MASVVGGLLLVLAITRAAGADTRPAARAATDKLLETITVDAGKTTLTTGNTQLKAGTKYTLHVSGTFTLANGNGQTYTEDALYCFGDAGFVSPYRGPTPMRFGDFYIGSGSSSLQSIDAYQEPAGGGTPLGYSVSHTYIVDFYPPADGTLTAGGLNAKTQCTSNPTPCTTTITGTMTIDIYGTTGGGGGGSLAPPTKFCPGTATTRGPIAHAAAESCIERSFLRYKREQKREARYDLKGQVRLAAVRCLPATLSFDPEVLDDCEQMMHQVVHSRSQ